MKRSILTYFKNAQSSDSKPTYSKKGYRNTKKSKTSFSTEIIEISSDEECQTTTINAEKSVQKNSVEEHSTPSQQTSNYRIPGLEAHSGALKVYNSPGKLTESNEDKGEHATDALPYYLKDFFLILSAVLNNQNDKKLFYGEDMEWIEKFQNMQCTSQKLYIRLYQRKCAWLPIKKVSYPQITHDTAVVLNDLAENGFLLDSQHENCSLSLVDVLHLLSAPDVKNISKLYHIQNTNKEQNVSALLSMCKQQKSLFSSQSSLESKLMKRALTALGKCYKLSPTPQKVFNRLLLVFDVTKGTVDDSEYTIAGQSQGPFYGKHQQLASILLAGMGKIIYPTYTIHDPTPIFQSRLELLEYETAYQMKHEVMVACDSSLWQQALDVCERASMASLLVSKISKQNALMMKPFMRTFSASSVYIQILSLQVEILQKMKKYDEASSVLKKLLDQNNFCLSRKGYWAERLALNLDQHMHDEQSAIKVVVDMLSDEYVRVGHKISLIERYHKLCERPKVKEIAQKDGNIPSFLTAKEVHIAGRILPKRMQTGSTRFMWQTTDSPDDIVLCSVEEYALAHYKSLGFNQGLHGEGGTLSCFFCLLMWDIIFMEGVPDVFRTQFQTHPLDLYTDEFYTNRKTYIDQRLQNICDWKSSNFSVIQQLTETWNLQQDVSCAGMNWQRFSCLQQVLSLATCIGGKTLGGILKIMSKDLRHTRSGLPDLVVWNPASCIYKFVEVKGPGDRLQNNQKMWMHQLVSLGACVEVCYVSASASRKLKA